MPSQLQSRTSYSGADIRVSVRVYDNGELHISARVDEIQKAIDDLEGQKDAIVLEQGDTNTVFSWSRTPALNKLHQAQTTLEYQLVQLKKSTLPYSVLDLTELQTISISIYREKIPVRALGSTYPRGYTRGGRTIAGSMIFTVFDEHVFSKLWKAAYPGDQEFSAGLTTNMSDQLPPIDVQIFCANEAGNASTQTIYGVEFIQEGQTMSIEDMFTENVFQYVARDMDPLRKIEERSYLVDGRLTPIMASDLLREPKIDSFIQRTSRTDIFKKSDTLR